MRELRWRFGKLLHGKLADSACRDSDRQQNCSKKPAIQWFMPGRLVEILIHSVIHPLIGNSSGNRERGK
jgi:hypothetical protein